MLAYKSNISKIAYRIVKLTILIATILFFKNRLFTDFICLNEVIAVARVF